MREPEIVLPELDCMDDPTGGAAAFAVLIVGALLVTSVFLMVMWASSAAW